MKKIILYAASVILLAGCSLNDYDPVADYSDVTEGKTADAKEPEFADGESVRSYMVSLRDTYKNAQEHWYLDYLLIGDAHSDNAYAGTTGAEVIPFEVNTIDGGNSVLYRDWERHLGTIAAANKIITHIDDVSNQDLSAATKQQYISEAKILRAMAMFDMVRIWGNIPVITSTAEQITSDNVEDVYSSYFPTQSTGMEAYQQIEKDLLEVLANPNAFDQRSHRQKSTDQVGGSHDTSQSICRKTT